MMITIVAGIPTLITHTGACTLIPRRLSSEFLDTFDWNYAYDEQKWFIVFYIPEALEHFWSRISKSEIAGIWENYVIMQLEQPEVDVIRAVALPYLVFTQETSDERLE